MGCVQWDKEAHFCAYVSQIIGMRPVRYTDSCPCSAQLGRWGRSVFVSVAHLSCRHSGSIFFSVAFQLPPNDTAYKGWRSTGLGGVITGRGARENVKKHFRKYRPRRGIYRVTGVVVDSWFTVRVARVKCGSPRVARRW